MDTDREPDADSEPSPDPRRRRRVPRALAAGLGLVGLGAVAGGIATAATTAGAATTTISSSAPTSSPAPPGASSSATSSTTTPSGSPSASSPTAPGSGSLGSAPPGAMALPLSGTVTAVGSSDVTIRTSTGTTTYTVTSSSDIDKNGEATLSDLAAGDAVTFSTVTTNGTTSIDKLHAGNAQLDMPAGGHPGAMALPLSGTVTAVGSSDVTIRTSTGTTTYAVTSSSDIDKNGEATLSDLAAGDAVTFSTVTTNGTTSVDKLHAGNAQLDMPAGGPRGTAPSGAAPAASSSVSA
jgi:Cu/Ag efflux protein CusF